MVGAGAGTLMVKVSALEGAELGPPVAAWVAVTEGPASLADTVRRVENGADAKLSTSDAL